MAPHGEHLKAWNDRLSAFVDEALTDEESREVLAHLEGCDICRARVGAYLKLRAVVSALPRRAAPRLPYLTRARHRLFPFRMTPAVWALSGATATLLILVITYQSVVKQRVYHPESLSVPAPREMATPPPAQPVTIPEKEQEEVMPSETATESAAGVETLEAREQKDTTEGIRVETESARMPEEPSPSAPQPPQRQTETETKEAESPMLARAPSVITEPSEQSNLFRVTLILPLEPPEEKVTAEAPPVPPAKGVALPERLVAPAGPSDSLPRSHQTITFIVPEDEWREFEVFLKKHYALVVVVTAPGEVQATLSELSSPPEPPQMESEDKEGKKDEESDKNRAKKFRMP